MTADELRKEFEKKSGLLEVGLDVMYRPDDGRIPYFRDAYVEDLESLVLSQAEQIEALKAERECPKEGCERYDIDLNQCLYVDCRRPYPDLYRPQEDK